MGEIRCPMCGKSNPEELENCQFCDARLTPLMPESSEDNPENQPSSSDDSMNEWLSFLRDSGSEGENEAVPAEQLPADDALPDWLDSLRGSSAEVPHPFTEETPAEEAKPEPPPSETEPDWLLSAELPDQDYVPEWLTQLDVEAVQEDQPLHGIQPAQEGLGEADDEPDWLRRIRIKRQEDVVEGESDQSTQEVPSPEPDVPEAVELSSETSEGTPQGEPAEALEASGLPGGEEQHPEPPAENDLPDWLAGLVAGKAVASAADTSTDADAEGLPDWLADLDRSPSREPGLIVPFGEEEPGLTFDWLQEQVRADQGLVEPAPAGVEEGADTGKVEPFVGDLSDFLEEGYLAAPESEREVEPAPGEDLAPAELPNWLEAMRPLGAAALGAAAAGESEAQIEASGPLAGLRGVVPAEPDVARLKKPPAYTIRMQVSDTQQTNAAVLDEVVKSEGGVRPVAGRPAIASQYVWRAIIFLILVAVVSFGAITSSQDTPLPSLIPEVLDASSAVDRLPSNPIVLLAVDYDPGYAGELQPASSAFLSHLILKGSYLALVSTSPSGVALAEELLQQVSGMNGFPYQEISQYANLGYISGSTAGLLGFAQSPRQIAPYAMDVNNTVVWEQGPLQKVQEISDFDMVAVLTEDPDKARAWIEQVQPQMASKPLVMVVSAQAEPMVRPYYQSNPQAVTGLVAGYVGGGSYESAHPDLMSGEGPVRRYWDSFTTGMLAALILIGVGVLADLSLTAVKNRKEEGDQQP